MALANDQITVNKESVKIIGWVLLILGILDLAQWVLTGFSYGWTNTVFGDNFLTQYGPWLAVVIGTLLITTASARENAAAQMALAEVALPTDETALYRENNPGVVLSLTNKRLMVRGIGWNALRNNPGGKIEKFPDKDSFELRLDEIAEIRPVRFSEVTSSKLAGLMGRLVTRQWGVSAILKSGQVLNFPVGNPELLAAHFRKISIV